MSPQDWERIKKSYEFILDSDNNANKLENEKWSIYRVGSNVVRIDIKVKI